MSDMGVLSFTRPLLRRFQACAPNIEIEIQKVDARVSEDLAVGRLDAVVGNLPMLAMAARSATLFVEHYVCLMAADHPTIGERLTLQEFIEGRHIVLSTPTPGNQLIEESLAESGVSRRIVARVPHFSGLADLLVQSDLLVVVPSRAAHLHADKGRLKALKLPMELPTFEVRVYWHARHDASPAHRWLIAEITTALLEYGAFMA
jgi:DNA-binding transcriptional LysR family regulator